MFASCVCDTPIAPITGGVSSFRRLVRSSPWNYSVACTRVNRVMLVYLRTETIKSVIVTIIVIVFGRHRFLAEESGNVDAAGNFSIQVGGGVLSSGRRMRL